MRKNIFLGLRSPCRKAYRFESDPGHQPLKGWSQKPPLYRTPNRTPSASIPVRNKRQQMSGIFFITDGGWIGLTLLTGLASFVAHLPVRPKALRQSCSATRTDTESRCDPPAKRAGWKRNRRRSIRRENDPYRSRTGPRPPYKLPDRFPMPAGSREPAANSGATPAAVSPAILLPFSCGTRSQTPSAGSPRLTLSETNA